MAILLALLLSLLNFLSLCNCLPGPIADVNHDVCVAHPDWQDSHSLTRLNKRSCEQARTAMIRSTPHAGSYYRFQVRDGSFPDAARTPILYGSGKCEHLSPATEPLGPPDVYFRRHMQNRSRIYRRPRTLQGQGTWVSWMGASYRGIEDFPTIFEFGGGFGGLVRHEPESAVCAKAGLDQSR